MGKRQLHPDTTYQRCKFVHSTHDFPRLGPGCVLCPRINPLRFLAGCRRRRLNQGLVVALGFFSLLDMACFCVIFSFYGCMLCLVRFVISTSVIDCLGRFVPEMTYYVSSGTLNLTKPCSTQLHPRLAATQQLNITVNEILYYCFYYYYFKRFR